MQVSLVVLAGLGRITSNTQALLSKKNLMI